MTQALIVIDVQNEFSSDGKRPVPNHAQALEAISRRVAEARLIGEPIAWVRHFNRPDESAAFVPGTWGAEFSPGFGPRSSPQEAAFTKHVYGAFTGTELDSWLRSRGVDRVLFVGFYTHGCVATSARDAIDKGFNVLLDPQATGARSINDPLLGEQSADEVKRTTLLQLTNLGARLLVGTGENAAAVRDPKVAAR